MISVIFYNHKNRNYFEQSIVTLLQQETDWEAVIINDGSPNGKIPNSIINDQRIRFFDIKKPVGFLRSIAVGLSLIKGDYCIIQRNCDAHTPNRFKIQKVVLDVIKADMTFDIPRLLTETEIRNLSELKDNGFYHRQTTCLYELLQKHNLLRHFGCVSSCLFRTDKFNVKLLNESLRREQTKPSLFYCLSILFQCLPEKYYQTDQELSIINCKKDIEFVEEDDIRRLKEYNQ